MNEKLNAFEYNDLEDVDEFDGNLVSKRSNSEQPDLQVSIYS